jgi:hypothetical protein
VLVHGCGQLARWAIRLMSEHLAPEPVDEFRDRGKVAIGRTIEPLDAHGDGSIAASTVLPRDFAVESLRTSGALLGHIERCHITASPDAARECPPTPAERALGSSGCGAPSPDEADGPASIDGVLIARLPRAVPFSHRDRRIAPLIEAGELGHRGIVRVAPRACPNAGWI